MGLIPRRIRSATAVVMLLGVAGCGPHASSSAQETGGSRSATGRAPAAESVVPATPGAGGSTALGTAGVTHAVASTATTTSVGSSATAAATPTAGAATPTSEATYRKLVNAICDEGNTRAKLLEKPKTSSVADIYDYARRVLAVSRAISAQIALVPPPRSLAKRLESIERQNAVIDALLGQVFTDPSGPHVQELTTKADSLKAGLTKDLRSVGLTHCSL